MTLDLPPTIDIPTAAELLGVGRNTAYELVRRGEFPTPVLRLGRKIRVLTGPLAALLGLSVGQGEAKPPVDSKGPAEGVAPSEGSTVAEDVRALSDEWES